MKHRDSKPAQTWAGDGQSEAEALRCRCRIVVLMQRACDAMHAQSARHMPLDAQLQLLSVLQVCAPLPLLEPAVQPHERRAVPGPWSSRPSGNRGLSA